MRSSIKKQLIEMVEYIDFPMGIYVYETGKVIAANRKAKEVLNGTACQNINLLWPNHKKQKLLPEVLAGKSQIFYEKAVEVGEKIQYVDFELNVIPLPNEHIVVAFFDRSYKQAFRFDNLRVLPGMAWQQADGTFVTINTSLRKGLERYLYVAQHREKASRTEIEKMRMVTEERERLLQDRVPSFSKVEQVDFNEENSGFVSMNKIPIIGKYEEFLGILMVCNPIVSMQEYCQMYANARFENALLRECMMAENKVVLGVSYTEQLEIRYTTPNFQLLGYEMDDVLVRRIKWLDLIHEEDRARVVDELKTAQEEQVHLLNQKYRIILADGTVRWTDVVTTGSNHIKETDILHLVVQMDGNRDRQAVTKAMVAPKHETYLDFLTGLPNRMKYEEDAQKLIEAALAGKKKGYVIALDLDDFKHINEGLGPEYGDNLLKQVSKALNNIPQVENYCYRVDGDEFLLFVRGEYEKEVEDIIQKCLALFHENWQLEDRDCFCSVSIGITEYPKDSTRPKELLKYADAAVYEAKRKGKNRIQHYKKAVLNTSVERINYEKYLRKAIAKGCVEFEMFFQPVVLTQTKELVSAEALVRWYSPELGFITPINFISLSEYLGLIVPLGEYVLQQTFLACKKWNDRYNPEFKVSVNLSVVQLVQPNIVDRIMEIARITQVNTENIILEVTESLAVEDMNLMKSVLLQLRAYGFSIALDDFGTGYSSINHIMEMPLNYVKIDKSFVQGYGTEQFNPRLLSATVELAHSVNTEVIVEGVETKQQMEFLMFLNADKIQGYLYGKPMPANEFEEKFFGGE